MRVGIIGLGRAGSTHLQACGSIPAINVAAVCDPAPSARRALHNGTRAYADLATMLRAEQLDAVTICTPPAQHVPLAIHCLEQGLHVLSEKPFAVTSREALELVSTARRCQRVLQVASKFRHVPEIQHLREILRAGELGDPIDFEISFCSPVDMSERWNALPASSGGGVIIDNGCHAFDIVHFLFGSVTRVHTARLKAVQRLGVEDAATVRVWAGDGVVGNVRLSWSWATGSDAYLTVHGTRGSAEIGWHGARVRLAGKEWHSIGGRYDKVDAHRRMHACFVETVSEATEPWVSAIECVRIVATVEATYRSMHSGAWERILVPTDAARADRVSHEPGLALQLQG